MAKVKERQENAPIKRRRRHRGVPKGLTIALIAIALVVGGSLGYLVGHQGDGDLVAEREVQLASADQRIMELENMLTSMGVDPNADVFDGAVSPLDEETTQALSGEDEPVNNNDVLVAGNDMETPAATAAPAVVAEFDGVEIMSDEVLAAYNESVNRQLLMGQDVSAQADTLLEEALNAVIAEHIEYQKAEELGLTELSAEDEQAIDEQAQQAFEEQLTFYVFNDGSLTDDEAREAAIERMAEDGTTLESLRAQIEENWWEDKLREYVTQDVTVSDEALQERYDTLLSEQEALYTTNPEQFEYAHRFDDSVVVYNPAGYRAFKQVLIAFDDADAARAQELLAELNGLDETQDAERIAEINGELDVLYAALEPTADEVLDRVAQGEDSDTLVSEYSQDPNLDTGSVREDGYYVCATSTSYDPAIVEAALALTNVGSVSTEPVRTSAGLHILYYSAEVPAGAVPLDEVRDALEADVLETLQYDAYEQQLAQWIEETEVVYHREALQ